MYNVHTFITFNYNCYMFIMCINWYDNLFNLSNLFFSKCHCLCVVIANGKVEGVFIIFKGSPLKRELEQYLKRINGIPIGYHFNKKGWCDTAACVSFINWYGRLNHHRKLDKPKVLS